MDFFSQVFVSIISALGLGFMTLVWKFVKAVNEVPRVKKGIRMCIERIEALEKREAGPR